MTPLLVPARPDVLSFDALQFLQEEVEWAAEVEPPYHWADRAVTTAGRVNPFLRPPPAQARLTGEVRIPYHHATQEQLHRLRDLLAESVNRRFGPVTAVLFEWRGRLLTAESAYVHEVTVAMPGTGLNPDPEWVVRLYARTEGPFHVDVVDRPV